MFVAIRCVSEQWFPFEYPGENSKKSRRSRPVVSSHPLDKIDIANTVVSFISAKAFVFGGGISKTFHEAWDSRDVGTDTLICSPDTSPYQLLESLSSLNLPSDTRVCRAAARSGNIRCLVLSVGKGCVLDGSVGVAAARGGDDRILEWLWTNGVEWDEAATCVSAAESGNVAALR